MDLGPRERSVLAETVYNVLRQKLRFEHLAKSGTGVRERRLAILGWAAHLDAQARQQQPQLGWPQLQLRPSPEPQYELHRQGFALHPSAFR
jgi:hypothetical protein